MAGVLGRERGGAALRRLLEGVGEAGAVRRRVEDVAAEGEAEDEWRHRGGGEVEGVMPAQR